MKCLKCGKKEITRKPKYFGDICAYCEDCEKKAEEYANNHWKMINKMRKNEMNKERLLFNLHDYFEEFLNDIDICSDISKKQNKEINNIVDMIKQKIEEILLWKK